VNTKIDDLKQAVVKMIKAGIPVFFGCDVGQSSDRNFGIMDTKLYKFEVSISDRSYMILLIHALTSRMPSISSLACRRLTVSTSVNLR
jgi:aminopeptidase C